MIKKHLKGTQNKIGQNILVHCPLSPNQISLLSLLIALIAAGLIISNYILIGAILFLIAGIFDAIDGAVARAKKQATKFGAYLDGVIDRFVEASFLFALMFYPFPLIFGIHHSIFLGLLIFTGTCMPSFVRAYADHKQVIDHKTANQLGGIFERSERIIAIVLGLIIGAIFGLEYFTYLIILASILSIITIIQRIYTTHKSYELKSKN